MTLNNADPYIVIYSHLNNTRYKIFMNNVQYFNAEYFQYIFQIYGLISYMAVLPEATDQKYVIVL